MASRSFSLEPLRSHIDLRRRCLLSFEAKIFTVAASLIALACVLSEVGTRAPLCLEGVNNTFFKSVWVQKTHLRNASAADQYNK